MSRRPTPAELEAENALLHSEVDVARRAATITAELVVEQFVKMEEVNALLQQKANIERELQEQLRQELRQSATRERELEEARRDADAANRTKSTFLANMSHELRTPLNAIIGYSELVEEELEDLQISALTPDLQKITAAARHLLALINDVLDLSKIEAGKFDLLVESFDLGVALGEVVATIQPLVRTNSNTLTVECDAELGTMRADLTRLRQCLFNLLSNACKFTDHGAIILAVRRAAGGDGDQVTFSVQDSGIGMSVEQLGRLFQPFTQLDASSTRRYGGTGLGLSITKRYCELMGGTITVASQPGLGCTFTMRLPGDAQPPCDPTATAAPGTSVADDALAGDGATPLLLVIDDEPSVREWTRRTLAGPGLRVVTAADGKEGLARARELRPSVIVLDVLMPGMDGWAVLGELKADPELAGIPVIVATILDDRELGFALGAADFVTKPLDRERLLELVNSYAGGERSRPILVVDDDPAARETARRTLRREQWSVIEAENGRVALERVAEVRPALILLDLLMPEMDGFDFLTQLRARPEWGTIPVVVITAKGLTGEDRARLDCVERVIQKGSFSRTDLLAEVNRIVRQGSTR